MLVTAISFIYPLKAFALDSQNRDWRSNYIRCGFSLNRDQSLDCVGYTQITPNFGLLGEDMIDHVVSTQDRDGATTQIETTRAPRSATFAVVATGNTRAGSVQGLWAPRSRVGCRLAHLSAAGSEVSSSHHDGSYAR
jgi:hypothetical protein